MKWFKVWVERGDSEGILSEKFIEGFTAEERWLFVGLLALSAESKNPGYVSVGPRVGYTDAQLSKRLGVPVATVSKGLLKFVRADMIVQTESGVITICNWKQYQSDCSRVETWRTDKRSKNATKTIDKENKPNKIDGLTCVTESVTGFVTENVTHFGAKTENGHSKNGVNSPDLSNNREVELEQNQKNAIKLPIVTGSVTGFVTGLSLNLNLKLLKREDLKELRLKILTEKLALHHDKRYAEYMRRFGNRPDHLGCLRGKNPNDNPRIRGVYEKLANLCFENKLDPILYIDAQFVAWAKMRRRVAPLPNQLLSLGGIENYDRHLASMENDNPVVRTPETTRGDSSGMILKYREMAGPMATKWTDTQVVAYVHCELQPLSDVVLKSYGIEDPEDVYATL